MSRSSLRSTCLVALFAVGCAAPAPATTTPDAPDPAAVRATIEATEKEWSAAYLKGDATAVAALYTEDGASVQPAGEWARGREAIARSMQPQLDTVNVVSREDVTEEITVAGDYVVEIGHYAWNGTTKKGARPVSEKGRYMVLWKKDASGAWKLHRDIGAVAP